MKHTLKCQGLTKVYKKNTVVNNIDLELEPGKIYGLIGRNGAGKTTLMSMLTAQNPPSSGSVTFDGMPVWENEKALSHLSFIRECESTYNAGMNPFKIKEYLKVAAMYLPHWDASMAENLLKKFKLDPKKKISRLSKGQTSMVTILTALASRAEFTFLDEPAAGLDAIARQELYHLLLEEKEEMGRTFVMSTHIIEEAKDVFDEVIFMKQGKLLLKEKTEALLERCVHVSGRAEAVEKAVSGMEVHGKESFGRTMGVTVLLAPGERIPEQGELTVQRMNLEHIFTALCGEAESE